jgi:hypothetical protein
VVRPVSSAAPRVYRSCAAATEGSGGVRRDEDTMRVPDRKHTTRHIRTTTLLVGVVAVTMAVASCVSNSASTGTSNVTPVAASSAPADSGGHSVTGHGTHPAPVAAALRTGERFVNVTMPQAYTPVAPNGGTDEYRCFLVDPKITAPAFLTGSQFLPQNADIVHHAIFFRIPAAAAAQARTKDADTPGQGWTCFGDTELQGPSDWVGHWAPGANETLLQPGVGYPLQAGDMLVMQVHYNLLATGGKPGGTDRSGIRLRLTDTTTGMTSLRTAKLFAPIELPCASGETGPLCDRATAVADVTRRFGDDVGSTEAQLVDRCGNGAGPTPGSTQHCDHQTPNGMTVYAVAGHMHLLGRAIKIEVNPGTAGARTLLDIPAYNFDDQGIRPLATPATIHPGDNLRVTCTHDAGLRRQLPALRTLPPRYVVWGDGTSDEMCLGLLVVAKA